ncbi:hypothetical protein IL306_008946 [Fusarium sp. DS 682]|nr:hypothetical protein IL306_008946 [Fusarium sp. DS 682]
MSGGALVLDELLSSDDQDSNGGELVDEESGDVVPTEEERTASSVKRVGNWMEPTFREGSSSQLPPRFTTASTRHRQRTSKPQEAFKGPRRGTEGHSTSHSLCYCRDCRYPYPATEPNRGT